MLENTEQNPDLENPAQGTESGAEGTPEVSLDNLRAGKISLRALPYTERQRLKREAYDQVADPEEKQAWDAGWSSKEFFLGLNRDGTPKEFTDHKEYLKRVQENEPVRNERLRSLAHEKSVLQKQMEDLQAENRKIMELVKMREERDLAHQEARIEREMQEARDLQDVDKFAAAQSEKAQVQSNKLKLKEFESQPPAKNIVAPETIEWGARNAAWFQKDQEMTLYAVAQEKALQETNPGMSLGQRLEMIEKTVKSVYSDRFAKPATPAVESAKSSGSLTNLRKNESRFGELPESERWQARQMIKRGVFKDEEDFMKGYNKINKK